MTDNDVQLEQKKRSRRRLVGAIALALVAAIVLPMIMDSEPKPAGSQLQIRIPGQEGSNFASRMIAGNAPPPKSPSLPESPSSSAAVQDSAPVEDTGVSSAGEEVALPAPAEQAPAAKPVSQKEEKPEAARKSEHTSHAASSSSSSRSSSHVKPVESDAQRARDILDGKAIPAATGPSVASTARTGDSQKLYVQLGVFRDEANAQDIVIRAASVGVKAVSLRAGDKTRLRAGPFADRTAADAVITKLHKSGINGIVVSK